ADLNRARLYKAFLNKADLSGADLSEARLIGANLNGARLSGAFLSKARLDGADLGEADLTGAWLNGANLSNANLSRANLSNANLSRVDMKMANLTCASLVSAYLEDANLDDCRVCGVNAWDSWIINTSQFNLTVTSENAPEIVLDNLALAQFIYLLVNHVEIRDVIDTITAKAVLILGRFKGKRRVILDALRDELRKRDYMPILFDFDKLEKDGTDFYNSREKIGTLARMTRFTIADITDTQRMLRELKELVPTLPSVAIHPLILCPADGYVLLEHFKNYPWVLPSCPYYDTEHLLTTLAERVIAPAEAKVKELRSG
ncbi:MAG: pentapeptide repeat-containing protein, partial [Anaerolineae bacterium]|nr:pentapeptide repeat-containing protein [Anaerolineae bacterium]